MRRWLDCYKKVGSCKTRGCIFSPECGYAPYFFFLMWFFQSMPCTYLYLNFSSAFYRGFWSGALFMYDYGFCVVTIDTWTYDLSVLLLNFLGHLSKRHYPSRQLQLTMLGSLISSGFLSRLPSQQFGLLRTGRAFSTSPSIWFPKLKTHSGTKKRWRSLPNGLFKRVCLILGEIRVYELTDCWLGKSGQDAFEHS